MAKDSVFLEIKTCKDCPHLGRQKYYTADSWDSEETWFCKKTKRPKPESTDAMEHVPNSSCIAIVDWRPSDEPKKIPKWCPLRAKKKTKKKAKKATKKATKKKTKKKAKKTTKKKKVAK